MKKLLKWLGIGVVAIIVLSVIFGGKGNNNSSSNNQNTANTTTAATAKINEPVQDGDLVFTAVSTETAAALGGTYTRRQAQGQFLVVTLKIENKGKETKTVDSSMITLTDNQGRKFDRSIEGQTAKGLSQGKVDLFLQQVQPGLSVTGDIVFDIPKDAEGLKLVVKESIFGKGKEISLEK